MIISRWFVIPALILASPLGTPLPAEELPSPAVESSKTLEGEWGKLQCYEVVLSPPTSNLWAELFSERSVWKFPGLTQTGVEGLLRSLNFSPETLSLINGRAVWNTEFGVTELDVDDAIIEAVSKEERTALFRWFRTNNPDLLETLIINFEDRNLKAMEKELSPEIMAKLRSVIFERGSVTSTFDRPYLLRQVETREEKEHLLRTLLTTHALVARLEVDPSADPEIIINYWEAGGRNPRVRVLIEGLHSTDGVDHLDILHLLPPMPRKYLNSFTVMHDLNPANAPDCFWTAIQFFSSTVSTRSFDPLPTNHFLEEDYVPVSGPLQFGDLVCLFDEGGTSFIHSYIHIAGDLVFTKNGGTMLRPWVITTKERMMAIYNETGSFQVETYRRKIGT